MERVTVTRTFDADPGRVEAAISDIERLMEAAGFEEVRRDGDLVTVENRVGIASMELTVRLVDDERAALAYVQEDGIFEEMESRFVVTETDDGTEVRARTEFAVDVDLVGQLLDSTVVKRQRRKELESQFEYIESRVAAEG